MELKDFRDKKKLLRLKALFKLGGSVPIPFPDLTEYRTKDLFSPLEGQPGWWVYRGRADNWIAMSNGFNFDPKTTEDTIADHPDVITALVAGGGRFRLCLVIELDETCYPDHGHSSVESELQWRQQMLDKIWPVIDEANHKAPKFGRIPKELVLFTAKDKPLTRSPKGSIQRRLALQNYESEIDQLYEEAERGLLTQGLPPLKSFTSEDLVPFLTELCAQTLELEDLGPDYDVFAHGMDSFAVATIASRLKAALRATSVSAQKVNGIGIKLVYERPTATQMAARLSALLSTEGKGSETNSYTAMALLNKYEAAVHDMFKKPTMNGVNGTNGTNVTNGHASGHVAAVTGTTGSMGSYLLATLLARPDVLKVICLNRASDAAEKQDNALKQRGLPPLQAAIEQGRVQFMKIDVSAPKLGLADEEYTTLVQETTSIVHNAFPVNFLMTTQQFEPQFVGMLNLLEVVRTGKRHPSFFFVSSVSAATSHVPRAVIPEVVFKRDELKQLVMEGYGEAKYICERMTDVFANLSAKTSTPAATGVLRVGQVVGPLKGSGKWNVWEWLPSIIVSSKYLGVAPESIGSFTDNIDFVPVDALANIMSELIGSTEKSLAGSTRAGSMVYNVVNPQTTTWAELLPALKRVAPKVAPLTEWISLLEETKDRSTHILDKNPGVKLLDFYKGFVGGGNHAAPFDTTNLVKSSETAAKLGPITQEQIRTGNGG